MVKATKKAYDEILRRILTLEYFPGTYINTTEIAEQLGISRTPVREAVKLLEHEEIIEISKHSRTMVTRINVNELKRTNFHRVAVESEIIRDLILNYNEKALEEMKQNLEKQKDLLLNASRVETFDELDKEFHLIMFKAIGQEKLNELLRQKMFHKMRARKLGLLVSTDFKDYYNDHVAIYEAIKNKNLKEADEALRVHLSRNISKIDDLKKEKPHFFN